MTTNDVAQHGGHPANTKSCSLGLQHTSLILDMSIMIDSCHYKKSVDQYHVTISQAQVKSSSRSHFFWKLTADQMLVFRSDRGLISAYLLKTGWIVQKPVNANPGLKVN